MRYFWRDVGTFSKRGSMAIWDERGQFLGDLDIFWNVAECETTGYFFWDVGQFAAVNLELLMRCWNNFQSHLWQQNRVNHLSRNLIRCWAQRCHDIMKDWKLDLQKCFEFGFCFCTFGRRQAASCLLPVFKLTGCWWSLYFPKCWSIPVNWAGWGPFGGKVVRSPSLSQRWHMWVACVIMSCWYSEFYHHW